MIDGLALALRAGPCSRRCRYPSIRVLVGSDPTSERGLTFRACSNKCRVSTPCTLWFCPRRGDFSPQEEVDVGGLLVVSSPKDQKDLSVAPASSWAPAMSLSDQHDSPNLEDLTPEEANRIIHSHRKVRYGQSTPVPRTGATAGRLSRAVPVLPLPIPHLPSVTAALAYLHVP